MLSKEDFVQRVLDPEALVVPVTRGPSEPEDEALAELGGSFAPTDEQAIATRPAGSFARLLLEASGFGPAEVLPRAEVILGTEAVARSLPDVVYYWPKVTDQRPYQTLLFELERTGTELLGDPLFRVERKQEQVEDAVYRLIQHALTGFEKGGEGRKTEAKRGKQAETLVVVSVEDDRVGAGESRHLVAFGTRCMATDALEVFVLREEARDWEPALGREHLEQLYTRHFSLLDKGVKWQDAFITGAERKAAQELLDECGKLLPQRKTLQDAVVKLLDAIAGGFGLKKSRNNENRRLALRKLPDGHEIGVDPRSRTRVGATKPSEGVRVFDAEERLLGYILFCLENRKEAEALRARLAEHNHFHNVLVIYPEQGGGVLELWHGKQVLSGKLLRGERNPRFSGEGGVVQLLTRFLVVSRSHIQSAKDLAFELAYRAQHLHALAYAELLKEQRVGTGELLDLYNDFNKNLAKADEEQFADAYAQTITYGLLSACWLSHEPTRRFTRQHVADLLPATSPFLQSIFKRLINLNFDLNLSWLLDDLTSLLGRTHVSKVFQRTNDPVIHFYESFLAEYNPEQKRLRGVYYTPESAVRFVVRAVDEVVARQLESPAGLADASRWEAGSARGQHRVQILDPACGTGTFLKHVILLIHGRFQSSNTLTALSAGERRARWARYVQNDLAPRLFGFEVMVAPYVICHLQLSLTLVETGLRTSELPRLNIFLTNALQDPMSEQSALPGQDFLAKEGSAAMLVKRETAISIIIGNPPYSPSMYEDPWIIGLIESYKEGLNEKKVDLNREEWKFFRFSHWKINDCALGAIGFVINRSYLDGVTLRGMRRQLGETFPSSLIIDLHGDVKGRTVDSEHGPDENIFEIEQGVCITILAKDWKGDEAKHRYLSLSGPEAYKSAWLRATTLAAAEAQADRHVPEGPYYLWVAQRGRDATQIYDSWPQISGIFGLYSSGIQTKRDKLTIHFARAELLHTVREFVAISPKNAREKYDLDEDGRDWTVERAQEDLKDHGCASDRAIPILYRPFDLRWTFYTGRTRGFLGYPRREVMQHFVGHENLGLIVNRQVVSEAVTHFGVTRVPNCHGTFYLGNKGQDYLMPLYLYEEPTEVERRAGQREPVRRSNISADYSRGIAQSTGLRLRPSGAGDLDTTFGPEDVLSYLLALFHSPTYRQRYADRLHIDFPRVPNKPSHGLFQVLVPLGSRLVEAHTLSSAILPAQDVRFHAGPSRAVEKLASRAGPLATEGSPAKLLINRGSWFEGLTDDDWAFEVGGYQPLHKWLEARKKAGRSLSDGDVETFRCIVSALRTIRATMAEVDRAIDAHGGWPDAFTGGGR